MATAGILSREDRVELIEREIVDTAPIGSAHGGMVGGTDRGCSRASSPTASCWSACENPLRLDRHNEPQPDLMLLRPRADYYRT